MLVSYFKAFYPPSQKKVVKEADIVRSDYMIMQKTRS